VRPLSEIAGWVLGELDERASDALEAHLFACDGCTEAARLLLELRETLPVLARGGASRLALTPALLARLEADGIPLRRYEIHPGETVPCAADPHQAYAVTYKTAPLEEVARVDVELLGPDGLVMDRFDDVPFDRRAGAVILAEPGDSIRALPSVTLTLRLMGEDAEGTVRELGTYGLAHRAMD